MSIFNKFKSIRTRESTILPFLGISAVYLISRIAYLVRMPAFIDEATHILWAKEMLNANLVAGAYDGRWATIQIFAVASLLPFDPLLITRLVVVAAGFFTVAAIILSAKDLFSASEALVAGCLPSQPQLASQH